MTVVDNRLATTLAGMKLKSPVMTASGTFGFGEEFEDFVDLTALGAIVVKGTTLEPRCGNSGVRIAETPSGMLNCIGLENPGVDRLLKDILPRIAKYGTPVIVNISGGSAEDYGMLAARLDVPEVAAIELNVSCPNVKEGGIAFGTRVPAMQSVIEAAKRNTAKPVIIKLSPNVTDIVEMALAAQAAGADAISMINTLIGMAIDVRTRRPILGNIIGGLSGPAVKPVALRMVWQVAQAVTIPIIGMGGIMTGRDAVEFLLAGASAVAVGTANFVNLYAVRDIAGEINDYLIANGFANVNDIVGKLHID